MTRTLNILILVSVAILVTINLYQSSTITNQQTIIRQMTENPACTGAPMKSGNQYDGPTDEEIQEYAPNRPQVVI